MLPRFLIATIAVAPFIGACRPDARFTTKFASDFAPARHVVSVFGVYKDGQMSSEAWTELAPGIARSLGGAACEAAYGGPVIGRADPLASAIDDYASANGPTDELLGQLAPMALGDSILVLTVAGQLPIPTKVSVKDPPHQAGAGAAYGPRGKKPLAVPVDTNVLEMTVSLYSVAQRHSVAMLDMQYSGDSVDDALAKFYAELAKAIPASSCVGWHADGKPDPDQIRKLGE